MNLSKLNARRCSRWLPASKWWTSSKNEVLVVDDHQLYRAALAGAVAAACRDAVLYEAAGVAGLFDLLDRHSHADLLLLDLNLPGAYGFNALAHLRGTHPELPVIVVLASDDTNTILLALTFGAQGFVSKSADAATHRSPSTSGPVWRIDDAGRLGTPASTCG